MRRGRAENNTNTPANKFSPAQYVPAALLKCSGVELSSVLAIQMKVRIGVPALNPYTHMYPFLTINRILNAISRVVYTVL